jgi:hypothetical protein
MLQLLVTANVVPSSRILYTPTANAVPNSPIIFTLMMEAIRCPKTSVLSRATRRHIPEDGIPQE